MSRPPGQPENQPLDAYEENSGSCSAQVDASTERLYRKEHIRKLSKTEFVVGNMFCCPWTALNSNGETCVKTFRIWSERK